MDASLATANINLVGCLEELLKLYRVLLDLVIREKDLLIAADIDALNESNRTKEALLEKIRVQDLAREKYAKAMAFLLGLDGRSPRLLELAKKLKGVESEKLFQLHSTLTLMIQRVSEINKDNEIYTTSALRNLKKALGEIKETLGGKKTYEKKGKIQEGPTQSGNFMSREA